MAIFGELTNMSTPEILTMLGQRSGKLHFYLPNRSRYELHLYQGNVLSLRLDGVAVPDSEAITRHLNELSQMQQGRFEFVNAELGELDQHVSLARSAVLEQVHESENSSTIPDRLTRFKLRPGATQAVPDHLRAFLEQSRPHLSGGCSAAELAEALHLSEMRVQIYFQRLRGLGLITPVRAYAAQASSPHEAAPVPSQTDFTRPAAPAVIGRQGRVAQRPDPASSNARPPRGIVRRLLSALTLGAIK